MAKFVNFRDDFIRADESPLATNGWSAANVDIDTNVATAARPNGTAYQTTSAPGDADVQIEAAVASVIENLASTNVTGKVVNGNIVTFTLASAHGRPVGSEGEVTLQNFIGSSPPLDGTHYATFSGTADFAVDYGTPVTLGPTNGQAFTNDAYVSLMARVPLATDPLVVHPTAGYSLRLEFDASAARSLTIHKVEITKDGGGVGVDTYALEEVTTKTTTKSVTEGGSDLRVIQLLRMTVITEDRGVCIRGYLNNDEDSSPDIEWVDRGRGSDVTEYNAYHPTAGTWGFRFGAVGLAVELFEARDRYQYAVEDAAAGLTLAELRGHLNIEIARGSTSGVTDDVKDYFLNEAQFEVKNELGDLSLFTQRQEKLTLTLDGDRNADLPDRIDRLLNVYHSPSLRPVVFGLVASTVSNGLTVHFPGGPSNGTQEYLLLYQEKWKPLVAATDRTLVPQEFSKLIILSALRQIVTRATDPAWAQELEVKWEKRLASARRDLNRKRTMEKVFFGVTRRKTARGRWAYAPGGDERLLNWPY